MHPSSPEKECRGACHLIGKAARHQGEEEAGPWHPHSELSWARGTMGALPGAAASCGRCPRVEGARPACSGRNGDGLGPGPLGPASASRHAGLPCCLSFARIRGFCCSSSAASGHLTSARSPQLKGKPRRWQSRRASSNAGLCPASDSTLRKEREVMLQLKEVVDRQRDKIRAQDHEIQCKGQDTEALQEQLNRFMAMNENLRRKLAIVQAQLGSALEKKAEMEALWEAERGSRAAAPLRTGTTMEEEEGGAAVAPAPPEHLPGQRSFSKEELQQILQERNELKTSLFLVEEELAYYQRELLNDERVPALLLDAVKSAIKKQRKKIWAKMLGTEEEPTSREEEEEGEGWLTDPPGSDRTDGRLPESRIKSFFSQWYHRTPQPGRTEGRPGTWEIISAEDVDPGEEQREAAAPCGSSPPGRTSPLP